MIYLDSSVFLARIFSEDSAPPDILWDQALTSSRLLLYEVWTRIFREPAAALHTDEAAALLKRVELVELSPLVLERAVRPLPETLRTLDALHLATMDYLRRQSQIVELASYDHRLLSAARALGIEVAAL